MRDWSEERWIKVFLVDSPRWLSLSWQARGLYGLLQRVSDRDGYIDLGPAGIEALTAVLRAPEAELRGPLRELERAGLVVEAGQGFELPEHRDQQASRSSGAARQREYRRRVTQSDDVVTRSDAAVTPGDAVNMSGDVVRTPSDDQKRREENRRDKLEQIARAREAAARVPDDPRVKHLAVVLAANKKFAGLDHVDVAEDLVGGLGPLALKLTDKHAEDAVAAAAAEAETGANERRLRQVLGWKLKDQVQPQRKSSSTSSAKAPMVQQLAPGQTFESFRDEILRDNARWEEQRGKQNGNGI